MQRDESKMGGSFPQKSAVCQKFLRDGLAFRSFAQFDKQTMIPTPLIFPQFIPLLFAQASVHFVFHVAVGGKVLVNRTNVHFRIVLVP